MRSSTQKESETSMTREVNKESELLKEAITKAMKEQEVEAKKQSKMIMVSAKDEYERYNKTLAAFVHKMTKEFFGEYQFMSKQADQTPIPGRPDQMPSQSAQMPHK